MSGQYPPDWQSSNQYPPQHPPQYQSRQYQQYQQPWQPPQPPPRRKSWVAQHKIITGILAFWGVILVIIIAAVAGSPSPASPPAAAGNAAAPGAHAAKAAAKKAPARQTVTYVVTGSPADVTYGPAGTSLSGSVPMRFTAPLGSPVYYSIEAQLQGGGGVTCKIEVDGRVISESSASGGYNIAMCEIGQDPLSGRWADDNTA